LLFDDVRYLPYASINVSYFLFVAYVKCRSYEINRNQSKCYTWTEFGKKNVPRPNLSSVGPERTRTWTCTDTNLHLQYLSYLLVIILN